MAAGRAGAADRIQAFGLQWSVPLLADWSVAKVDGVETMSLLVPRPQQKDPRRPGQYALAETEPLGKFTLELEVKPGKAGESLIIVYSWRDAEHFDYVHLSPDAARKQPVHNGIFHVYGGDRSRISVEDGPGTLPDDAWRAVKVSFDAGTGLVQATVDGKTNPSLRAADLSLGAGRIGLGSFFNTAAFRNFRLTKS
jgi:hypothetical protein